MDCCSHGNRGNLPFALSLVRLCPAIHLWPSCASLTKTFGLEGREGTETPVPTMWPSIFFSCLSVVLAEKLLFEDFLQYLRSDPKNNPNFIRQC
ncbi:hypothetical protein INR49_026260 [Caranx melampygus]|nr:hypothetical protein INR49_026260 [Caranx melampygus]